MPEIARRDKVEFKRVLPGATIALRGVPSFKLPIPALRRSGMTEDCPSRRRRRRIYLPILAWCAATRLFVLQVLPAPQLLAIIYPGREGSPVRGAGGGGVRCGRKAKKSYEKGCVSTLEEPRSSLNEEPCSFLPGA